jgi:hypothetical protein
MHQTNKSACIYMFETQIKMWCTQQCAKSTCMSTEPQFFTLRSHCSDFRKTRGCLNTEGCGFDTGRSFLVRKENLIWAVPTYKHVSNHLKHYPGHRGQHGDPGTVLQPRYLHQQYLSLLQDVQTNSETTQLPIQSLPEALLRG